MKFTIVLLGLLLGTTLSAQNTKIEKLVGKWQLYQEIENGKDVATKCTRRTTVEFFKNGSYTIFEFIEESEFDDTCTSELRKGKWKNSGSSKYVFNDKKSSKIFFAKDTYYYIANAQGYTIKYVYRKLTD